MSRPLPCTARLLLVGSLLLAGAAGADDAPSQPFALEVPRVTAAELAANETLLTGHWPYVLVGEASKWDALERWDLAYLEGRIPMEWVDYYPENMLSLGKKPFLYRYKDVLPEFRRPSASPRYMQMRLSLSGWEELERDLEDVPSVFYTEAEWIGDGLEGADGHMDRAAVDNFYRVNQWNFLLIGENGTGIFFHRDHLSAASWQAAIKGRKRWILCPHDQEHLLSSSIDPFDGAHRRDAAFAAAYCGEVTVAPGEILYYPAYWWHATRNLDTTTVGLTGLMA